MWSAIGAKALKIFTHSSRLVPRQELPTSVARLGGKSQNISLEHRGTILSARLHVRRESAGLVHLGQGGPDHPSGERGGKEKAGDEEDGGADEGGEEGAVDGLPPGTWLGKERPMPWTVEENNIKYFPKHTLFVFV